MGYRSEVVLAIKAREVKSFLNRVVCRDGGRLFDSSCQIHTELENTDEPGIMFHWSWVKWYSDYTHVKAIEDFMQHLVDKGEESSYYFARIGEEHSDVQMHGDWWTNPFDIGITTEFHYSDTEKMDCKELIELREKREVSDENRYEEILKEI